MNKVRFTVLFLVCCAVLTAAPVLLEELQEGQASIPAKQYDNIPVLELSFSVDTNGYAIITTGGTVTEAKMGLRLDGVSLPPVTRTVASASNYYTIPYTCLLSTGSHTITLMMESFPDDQFPATCQDAYLQALIFLPDEPSAVTEAPEVEPVAQTASVISKGPYVSAPGASELVDASGRVIENAIAQDRVQISTLPPGTYFARDGERTVVKIVKVE